jgi:indolepyruvate ferredoxin oxidoreductase alpha subunit
LLHEARERWLPLEVDAEQCNGCGLCFRIGCPAILRSEQVHPKTGRHLAEIDPLLCTGCEVCAQVCFRDAIFSREEMMEKQEASA